MSVEGYLGIDAGTQGLSAVFTDEAMREVASGEGGYGMVPGLGEGCYEQDPADWEAALRAALRQLSDRMSGIDPGWRVRAVGISGQMHGEVACDEAGRPLGPARLWCDARNEAEAGDLTEAFGVRVPKRLTVARWLWTLRNRPDRARRTRRLTTPGGWLAHRLTGEWILGIGDASGMFPMAEASPEYDAGLLDRFGRFTIPDAAPLDRLLPVVRRAGGDGGAVREDAAAAFGLPAGIPVAPAEGDQPAALAGSLIAGAGMVSMSLGTSICANFVGDRPFRGMHPGIDHFRTADGRPLHIVWLRNGTTFMNRIVGMFAAPGEDPAETFQRILPLAAAAPPDCGGLLALPFLDDEPGLGVARGGSAWIGGLDAAGATPGHLAKAALLSSLYNLRVGVDELARRGVPRREIVLSGGATRTPEFGQMVSDVFDIPVAMLDSATEGSAWGAALLAKFRRLCARGEGGDWAGFLARHAAGEPVRFQPRPGAVRAHQAAYGRHLRLLRLQPELDRAIRGPE